MTRERSLRADSPTQPSDGDKPGWAQYLLQRGSIRVCVDARVDGVRLPNNLMGKERVGLQIGHDMPVPVLDLVFGAVAVSATLSFRGEPFRCAVPWAAVTVITDEEGVGRSFTGRLLPCQACEYLKILKAARTKLAQPGAWTKGAYARDVDGKPVLPWLDESLIEEGIVKEPVCWDAHGVFKSLRLSTATTHYVFREFLGITADELHFFNDECETVEPVLALFDRSIARLERALARLDARRS